MTENAGVIEEVLTKSDSALIIFVVLIIAALIPFYKVFTKDRKERAVVENQRQEKYIEQNNLMIKALNEVTGAIAKLDVLIELTTKDSKNSIERVHGRIDQIFDYVNKIYLSMQDSGEFIESEIE
jgi:hypothetical protein